LRFEKCLYFELHINVFEKSIFFKIQIEIKNMRKNMVANIYI
jgi:hypothetical protein